MDESTAWKCLQKLTSENIECPSILDHYFKVPMKSDARKVLALDKKVFSIMVVLDVLT